MNSDESIMLNKQEVPRNSGELSEEFLDRVQGGSGREVRIIGVSPGPGIARFRRGVPVPAPTSSAESTSSIKTIGSTESTRTTADSIFRPDIPAIANPAPHPVLNPAPHPVLNPVPHPAESSGSWHGHSDH